jgi:hypothetical protein
VKHWPKEFRVAKLHDEAGYCGGLVPAEGVTQELRRVVGPEQVWSEGEAFPCL